MSLYDERFQKALGSRGISSHTIYQLALKLCRDLNLSGDLLEFGAGTGNVIRGLLDGGYRGAITGADIQLRSESMPESVRWLQADLNEALPLADGSFDVILSTEVLPALENPRFLFREFFRLLRPRGSLLVTMPNQESIRSLTCLMGGGHFAAYRGDSYPAHITALLRKDFEHLCAETGFAPPRFFYTDEGGLPKLPGLTWQRLSFGLLAGRLFSDNFAVVTRKPE